MPDTVLRELLDGVALPDRTGGVSFEGRDPILGTRFRVGAAAAAASAACAVAADALWQARGGKPQRVDVDVRAAAAGLLSFLLMRGPGFEPFADVRKRDTIGLYPTRDDRWIHLHGGFPHLRDGLLELLESRDEHDALAAAVRRWEAYELEDAIAARNLCGAVVRSADEWHAHPQGALLARTPLVEILRIDDAPPREPPPGGHDRPLAGVRVLDLTRVLAGPTCGRTLAEHGAEVLRIDGPHLPHIPAFVLDTSHGKRRAHLDLRAAADVDRLSELVERCDVFSSGYRSGSLARRELSPQDLARMRPGIVAVSINCYGHEGPWSERGGWEQLAQTVSGIAAEQGTAAHPTLLPAAACDYITGTLAALGAMTALERRRIEGGSWWVRVSLAATAEWLRSLGRAEGEPHPLDPDELANRMQTTPLAGGALQHLAPLVRMSETPPHWNLPTGLPGEHEAAWQADPTVGSAARR